MCCPDERNHQMYVFKLAAHLGDRLHLESEEIRFTRISETPTITDHRIRFVRLVCGAAFQIAKLVRAEVHRPVDDGTRVEGAGECGQAVCHSLHELIGTSLREEFSRMSALQRFEHHELCAQ